MASTSHDASEVDDDIEVLNQQLEEIVFHNETSKGKHAAHKPSDNELAISIFQADVEAYLGVLCDQKLARSVAAALEKDATIIEQITREEHLAQQDRELALRISCGNIDARYVQESNETCVSASAAGSAGRASSMTKKGTVTTAEEEKKDPSTTDADAHKQSSEELFMKDSRCCVCLEHFRHEDVTSLQCEHSYCHPCLKGLFMRATNDESLFPPRCCRQMIPISLVDAELSDNDRERFENAKIEFSTTERVYCSNSNCAKFIRPSLIQGDRAQCDRCGSITCAMCKRASHVGDCPLDTALQGTLALAQSQGWQRCFACRTLVELDIGCNHMACKCGAQFCYICGVEWKKCPCETWQENNLIVRAEEVVDREAAHPLPAQERQRRINVVREELRQNHECNHPGRFRRVDNTSRRGVTCEMCGDRHWKYLLQCRQCYVRVCEDCRRHRVR